MSVSELPSIVTKATKRDSFQAFDPLLSLGSPFLNPDSLILIQNGPTTLGGPWGSPEVSWTKRQQFESRIKGALPSTSNGG